MERTYDIFEVVDGTAVWRKAITGHQDALNFAAQLAAKTPNEIRVVHLTSNALIAHLNPHEPPSS
jgi:hypothetical protein